MTTRVVKSSSYGLSSNQYKVERQLAQSVGRIAATGVTALTDNSGGASADGTIGAIGAVTAAAVGSNDALQAAAGGAGLLTVVNALKEIAAKCNTFNGKVPALGSGITDSLTGTAADGTIAAVTVSYSGVGASMASFTDVDAAVTALTNRIATLALAVNKLCTACGVSELTDSSGGRANTLLVLDDVTTTLTTATGADNTTHAIVLAADFAAKAALLAAAVKELATKLNALRDSSTGYLVATVVAV
jgi:hypothetical protein